MRLSNICHRKLNGRDHNLTNVYGEVVHDLIA